jgi:hypothetical protein
LLKRVRNAWTGLSVNGKCSIILKVRTVRPELSKGERQKPIDFATEGLRLALPVEHNCGIRVELKLPVIERARLAGKPSLFPMS